MLLTVTTTHQPATDLGFLLHKHPGRVRAFGVASGTAHVFYPEASGERCTAALLLEVDPVALDQTETRVAVAADLARLMTPFAERHGVINVPENVP